MQKFFYPIFKLPEEYTKDFEKRELPRWIKYYLYKKSTREVSNILQGNNFILQNTIKKNFKKFIDGGNSVQNGQPSFENEEPIHNVEGTIINKISNKNLSTGLRLGYYEEATGNYHASSAYTCGKEEIKVIKNTSYTFSIDGESILAYVFEYDKEGNYLGRISRRTYTPGDNVEKFNYSVVGGHVEDYPLDTKIQIEIGPTITPYTSHEEQILPFTLEEGQKLYIGDTLEDDGIHHSKAQGIVHISSITTLPNENIGGIISASTFTNKIHKVNNYLLCNKAIFSKTSRETGIIYENQLNAVIIGTPNDTLQSMQEKYDGAIVEYELGEEEIVPYTQTQQTQYNAIKNAYTYNDLTIVETSSDGASPILTLQYFRKKGSVDNVLRVLPSLDNDNSETTYDLTFLNETKGEQNVENN